MRIHLTLAFLDGLHGSVMHTREYAAYLKSQGHEVSVSCIEANAETSKMFTDNGIPVSRLKDVDVSAPYDVVYALHFPTLGMLLYRGLETRKLILSSLSTYSRLENYPVYWQEASLLTAMSEETRQAHHETYGIPVERIMVAENAVPPGFDEAAPPRAEGCPRRIAVISNHIPQELTEAAALLTKEIQTDFIGKECGNSKEVTPALLSEYDLVITIGKTVQYAMGMGIPVFEYDRYGGNGYILPDNMETEALHNFSGRPNKRTLPAETLAQEILNGYEPCRRQTGELRAKALERFSLAVLMQRMRERLEEAPELSPVHWERCRREYALYFSQCTFVCNWMLKQRREEQTLKKANAKLTRKVNNLAAFKQGVLETPKVSTRGALWRKVLYYGGRKDYYLCGIKIFSKQS